MNDRYGPAWDEQNPALPSGPTRTLLPIPTRLWVIIDLLSFSKLHRRLALRAGVCV